VTLPQCLNNFLSDFSIDSCGGISIHPGRMRRTLCRHLKYKELDELVECSSIDFRVSEYGTRPHADTLKPMQLLCKPPLDKNKEK